MAPRKDGGFDLELPRTYMPSKHYSKLEEVATGVVGNDGWYVRVNAQKLTASIIPSAPPTFPGMIPTPMDSVVKFDHQQGDLQDPVGHEAARRRRDGRRDVLPST